MGAAYFVIAFLGCADGGGNCTQVATLQTRYSSQSECSAATSEALETNNNFDFPTLLARCRRGSGAAAEAERDRTLPDRARRG